VPLMRPSLPGRSPVRRSSAVMLTRACASVNRFHLAECTQPAPALRLLARTLTRSFKVCRSLL
jgi:hypothetical protein